MQIRSKPVRDIVAALALTPPSSYCENLRTTKLPKIGLLPLMAGSRSPNTPGCEIWSAPVRDPSSRRFWKYLGIPAKLNALSEGKPNGIPG
jgi:hypothetical protein